MLSIVGSYSWRMHFITMLENGCSSHSRKHRVIHSRYLGTVFFCGARVGFPLQLSALDLRRTLWKRTLRSSDSLPLFGLMRLVRRVPTGSIHSTLFSTLQIV